MTYCYIKKWYKRSVDVTGPANRLIFTLNKKMINKIKINSIQSWVLESIFIFCLSVFISLTFCLEIIPDSQEVAKRIQRGPVHSYPHSSHGNSDSNVNCSECVRKVLCDLVTQCVNLCNHPKNQDREQLHHHRDPWNYTW